MGDKYSREQLRQMAREALADRDNGGGRWLRLVFAMMIKFDTDGARVVRKIEELAQ